MKLVSRSMPFTAVNSVRVMGWRWLLREGTDFDLVAVLDNKSQVVLE